MKETIWLLNVKYLWLPKLQNVWISGNSINLNFWILHISVILEFLNFWKSEMSGNTEIWNFRYTALPTQQLEI